MEILQNQYKHLDYNDHIDSVREFKLKNSSEKSTSSKDNIFSFRNELQNSHRVADVNQISSNDSRMNFLKDVNLANTS